MSKLLVSAFVAAGMIVAPASAAPIVFKGDGQNATPGAGATTMTCGSSGVNDFCSTAPGVALEYSVNGIDFTVSAFENFFGNNDGVKTGAIVIQDIQPLDSGLGVISAAEELNGGDDQVQSNGGLNESLLFDFGGDGRNPVTLSNIEFNAGNDRNCSNPGNEGSCGLFDLWVDGLLVAAGVLADDLVAGGWTGFEFEFVANTPGNDPTGFTIAQFDVQEVPIPGALPLLLSGIAGLGFAARRKKTA